MSDKGLHFGEHRKGTLGQYELDRFFELSQDLLCIAGVDGYFKELNYRWKETLGYDESELKSKPFMEFIHPHDQDKARQLAESIASGIPEKSFQIRHFCKDGSIRNLLWSAVASGDYMYASAKDVTEIVEYQKYLSHYHQIVENSTNAIISIGTDYRIQTWNPAATEIFEYSSSDAIGEDVRNLILPKNFPSSDILVTRTMRDHTTIRDQETKRITKSGEEVELALTSSPIYSSDQVLIGASLIARDLRREKAAERSAISSSKLASLGMMAAGIGHEINNPVTIISYKAKMLRDDIRNNEVDKEKIVKELGSIDETVLRISKIVSGIRAFSRDGANDPFAKCKLKNIIDSTLELCRVKIRDSGVDFSISQNLENIEIECREIQISQILLNLVGNSIDAVESLSEKWIRLETKEDERMVHLSIVDSGRGISKEVQSRIMDPFFTTKENGKGTGLGLGLSKKIVEEHKGRLIYDPTSENTRFVVSLWKNIPKRVRLYPRVLIVDDEPDIVDTLALRLKEEGFEPLKATSGLEALAIVADHQVDFLLLDIRMPQMTGIDLAKKIEQDLGNGTKTVFMTGHADPKTRDECLALGALAVLQKPFQEEDLVRLLDQVNAAAAAAA